MTTVLILASGTALAEEATSVHTVVADVNQVVHWKIMFVFIQANLLFAVQLWGVIRHLNNGVSNTRT